ncbi:MAG: hypothetical protein ACI8UO_005230 [Verrucomicrobiales bacterium]|jgi:hypothetical protein
MHREYSVAKLLLFALLLTSPACSETRDSAAPAGSGNRTVIAPPAKGIYLGQTKIAGREIADLEAISGGKIAIVADFSLVRGTENTNTPLQFDIEKANRYAADGYAMIVGAYEAHPGHRGFTVDRLIRGDYDRELSALAEQFRQCRGQLFFCTCREPNGVLREFFGGYGPDGDQELPWAIETRGGFADFKPPKPPKGAPDLFKGLGRDDVADGIERLGAAQRYYHDFFLRREGLTNLTFETMGWQSPGPVAQRRFRNDWEERLEKSMTFEQLLAAIGPYYDWISVNWYLETEPEDETGFPPEEGPRKHVEAFNKTLATIARVAPNRPIILTELGILPPLKTEKAAAAFELIRNSRQIKAIVFWGAPTGNNRFDAALEPGSPAAGILKSIIRKSPGFSQPTVETRR